MVEKYKTGSIWKKSSIRRGQIVRRVCESLEKNYGKPRLGNPNEPLDDLVYIIISNKTGPDIANKVYLQIKEKFKNWDQVLESPFSILYSIIEPAGLATLRSNQIRSTLEKIKSDFGKCNLDQLKKKKAEEVQNYLVSLPGVSIKVAKCVMMFTMDIDVLPVDSHIYRITKRLGWTSRKRADQCYEEIEMLIRSNRRYAFHVDCILHGRTICRPNVPKCKECCIHQHCESFQCQADL